MQRFKAITALLFIATVGSVFANDTAPPSDIVVDNAKMRYIPGGRPAAGYMTLINSGDTSIALVGAHTEAYERVELHRSVSIDGSMRMDKLDAIDIPAHDTLMLTPGDYHLMFMGIQQTVTEGNQLNVTLKFSDGHETQVQFQVVGVADEI